MSKGPHCHPVEPRARAIYDQFRYAGFPANEAREMAQKEIARQDKNKHLTLRSNGLAWGQQQTGATPMDGYSTFNTAPYTAYTSKELAAVIAEGRGNEKMVAEIARREKVRAGDRSVMTPGERLRFARAQ